jgi:hypothetical protein
MSDNDFGGAYDDALGAAESDATGDVLTDLQTSGIDFWLVCRTSTGIEAKLGDNVPGITASKTFKYVDSAVDWLSATACELYPDSTFARTRPYMSRYVPGSADACAAGCICSSDQPEKEQGYYHTNALCPEHGRRSERMIGGRRVRVADNWRPGDPFEEL